MFFQDNELGSVRTKKKPLTKAVFSVERKKRTYEIMTAAEMVAAKGDEFIFDAELFKNYFEVGFLHIKTGKILIFEKSRTRNFDTRTLQWCMQNFTIIGFNSRNYDIPVVWAASQGFDIKSLRKISKLIIEHGKRPRDIEQAFGLEIPKFEHIDIQEVSPLSGSLKTYAGRLHAKRMQDLPYHHEQELTEDEMNYVRDYNVNDLINTFLLYFELCPQLALRGQLSADYNQDLRSKSDAQIAEAVMRSEIKLLTGNKISRPSIAPGTTFKYQVPAFVKFETPLLQHALEVVRNADFVLSEKESDGDDDDDIDPIYKVGKVKLPESIKALDLRIGLSKYKFGNGGLHSSEECAGHIANGDTVIFDADVASYYPSIILILKLFPKHIGEHFLKVYAELVARRLKAKGLSKSHDLSVVERAKIAMDSIKIVINGLFGKLGSKWSAVFSPDLMIQVTVTGQLCLLMLIEKLELCGFSVISANTDGIVTKFHKSQTMEYNIICWQWMQQTGFQLEFAQYIKLFSRDVNNYVAVKPDGKVKGKGAFSNHWDGDKRNIFKLHKNPQNTICVEAVWAFLSNGTDIAHTVNSCRDITKFVTVRNVKGGGHQNGEYLGKVVRWYYSINNNSTIDYILSGNKVPKSEGAKPCMDLPDSFPDDIDFDWYIDESISMLYDLGFYKRKANLF
jgi:hypothetical protein